jgi:hypothetical protein
MIGQHCGFVVSEDNGDAPAFFGVIGDAAQVKVHTVVLEEVALS